MQPANTRTRIMTDNIFGALVQASLLGQKSTFGFGGQVTICMISVDEELDECVHVGKDIDTLSVSQYCLLCFDFVVLAHRK